MQKIKITIADRVYPLSVTTETSDEIEKKLRTIDNLLSEMM
jgi:hypothetical protein